MATPNGADATPFQPLVPEGDEADGAGPSTAAANDQESAAEQNPQDGTDPNQPSEPEGPSGIRGAINANRAVRLGVGLRRRRAIRDLTRKQRQLQRDIITKQRMLRRLKSKVLFQEVRVAVEAVTGIGLPAAAWELFRALQKNNQVKDMKKELKNLQVAEGSTTVQIARQYNLFGAEQQAAASQSNPPH